MSGIQGDKEDLRKRHFSPSNHKCITRLHRLSFTNLKLMNENGSTARRATRKLEDTCSNLSGGITEKLAVFKKMVAVLCRGG